MSSALQTRIVLLIAIQATGAFCTASAYAAGDAAAPQPPLSSALPRIDTDTQGALTQAASQPALSSALPLGRHSTVLESFATLLEVYQPLGRPLAVSVDDDPEQPDSQTGSEQSKPAGQVVELMRSALEQLGEPVFLVPHGSRGRLAQATAPGQQRADVLIRVAAREASSMEAIVAGDGLEKQGKRKPMPDIWLDLTLIDPAKTLAQAQQHLVSGLHTAREATDHSFEISLQGTTYALSRNSRTLEGAGSAVHLLIDLGLVESLGRYLAIPYWRCIPEAKPDVQVAHAVEKKFLSLNHKGRVTWLRDALDRYGFDLPPGQGLDAATKLAVDELISKFSFRRPGDYLDAGLFADIYLNIPNRVSHRR
jgi:hypothetical protein